MAAGAAFEAAGGIAGMTSGRAKQLAVLGPLTAAVLGFVASLSTKGALPPARLVFGCGIAAVMLTGLAEAAPPIAGGIALCLIVSAMFIYGEPAWKAVSNITAIGGAVTPTVRADKQIASSSKSYRAGESNNTSPSGGSGSTNNGGDGGGGGGGGSW